MSENNAGHTRETHEELHSLIIRVIVMRDLKIVSFLVVREDVFQNGQLLVSYAHFRVSVAPETIE